jgi:hypothetical protein
LGTDVKKDKSVSNRNRKTSKVSLKTIEATESVRSLIHSLNLPLEEKIAMEDQINNLSHETNCLLDIISNSKTSYQKKLFLAYRKFLERNIDAVDQRIDEL